MTSQQTQGHDLDQVLHSAIGRLTGGVSPAALTAAWLDWAMHVQGSPQRQMELALSAGQKAAEAWLSLVASAIPADPEATTGQPPGTAEETDRRFVGPGWNLPPFSLFTRWFHLQEEWWRDATAPLPGLDPAHQRMVAFAARQVLDMVSPANFALTNPEVLERTRAENGKNFLRGLGHWLEDFNRIVTRTRKPHPEFRVGETVAVTEGDVVFRNRLMELIRYRPTTQRLQREPILIVPAWIMKYYILDLSPHNSMVAWLRDQGFEVHVISWKNPGAEDADLSFADYLDLGLFAALDHVAPNPQDRVHAVGYCLGGTLLATGAAAMARDGDARLQTLSLLAAQVDFTEPGEISLFINESQVAFLEDIMREQGYLRADQMAGAFRMLRSTDLIWSRVVRHYLMGERTPMNDLMAWNADATRMPARMHSDYLRRMFLENRLATGRFEVAGKPVALADLRVPVFCLATEADHVSPWRSVFRIHLLSDTDVTFCLASGGHNGGVLSEPGHRNRHFRILTKTEGDAHVSEEDWLARAPLAEGSWWPVWAEWMRAHGSGMRPASGMPHRALGPAPGTYVFG